MGRPRYPPALDGLRTSTHSGDRHRLRRPGDRRRLRRTRQRGVVRRRRRRQDRSPGAGRDPDLGAGARGVGGPSPRPDALLHRVGRRAGARQAAVRGGWHAADVLRRRRPVGGACRRGLDARLRRARARDEVDGPGRHRHRDQATVRDRGQGLRLRLLSRVPQGGLGPGGLPGARSSGDRRRRQLGGRCGGRALRAAEHPRGPHRHRQRRDGQAGRQRVSGDEDLVHQRDRQRVRGDRRRRARGGPRDGP